jgi:hypothetical protein
MAVSFIGGSKCKKKRVIANEWSENNTGMHIRVFKTNILC